MNSEPPLGIVFSVLAILTGAGFFSMVETALISARKSRLRTKAPENKGYRAALEAAEHPGPFLFTARVWIGFLRVLAGVLGGFWAVRYAPFPDPGGFSPLVFCLLLIPVVTITLGTVLLGELIPRQIASLAPEAIVVRTLPLLKFLGIFHRPLILLSSGASKFISALFHITAAEPGITEDELRSALMEGEKSGIVESKERTMVEGVFYLGDRPVGTFMTHRSDIKWLEINTAGEELRRAVKEFPSQRYFPVATESLDEVVGLVSVEDILTALLEPPWKGLKSIMAPPCFIPETMSALKAFEVFKREDTDFLCVMDEYGGFAGALSVRDLVEEIVGELSGPSSGGEEILPQKDGTFLADGSVNIDEIVKVLSLSGLPGEHQEYHTLAGFILRLAGEIPRTGECFEWQGRRFKIVDMDGNRIDKVLIYPAHEG